MKNFKRFSSLVVAVIMIVATMSAMFVSTSAAEVGTVYSPTGIANGVLADGPFKAMAVLLATNEKLTPNAQSVEEWGTWRHKVTTPDNTEEIAVMQAEKPTITPNFGWGFNPGKVTGGLLVFTAPASGTYSLDAIFVKLYGQQSGTPTKANVSVYKNGTGNALVSVSSAKIDKQVTGEEFDVSVASVELAQGDELWIVVTRTEDTKNVGAANVQIKEFAITYVAAAQSSDNGGATGGTTGGSTTNPDTSDALVASLVVAVVAGVALVASKKRR